MIFHPVINKLSFFFVSQASRIERNKMSTRQLHLNTWFVLSSSLGPSSRPTLSGFGFVLSLHVSAGEGVKALILDTLCSSCFSSSSSQSSEGNGVGESDEYDASFEVYSSSSVLYVGVAVSLIGFKERVVEGACGSGVTSSFPALSLSIPHAATGGFATTEGFATTGGFSVDPRCLSLQLSAVWPSRRQDLHFTAFLQLAI